MNKTARELFFNISVFSILLSVVYSIILVSLDNTVDPDGFADITFLFLGFYLIHAVISTFNYVLSRFVGDRTAKKFIIFNVVGILVVGATSYFTQNITWMFLIISFLVLSIISFLNKSEQE